MKHIISGRRPILILAIALVFILSMTAGGCAKGDNRSSEGYSNNLSGSSSNSPASSPAAGGFAGGGSAPQGSSPPAASGDASGSGGQGAYDADESPVPLPLLTPSSSRGKKIVYTVDLKLQTTAFSAGIRTLLTTLSDMNGYVERATVTGRDIRFPETERNAKYTLRLDTEYLSDFILMAQENYNLLSMDQRSEDVTAKYRQTDSVLGDLREREARLLKDLENSKLETSDTLDLEKELASVQTAIRNAENQQAIIDDGIIYSTINVELFEVIFYEPIEIDIPEVPEPDFGEKLSDTATRSVNGFVAFCQGFLLVLIRVAPALVVIAVVCCIAYFIYRGVKKRREKHIAALNNKARQASSGSPDDGDA